MPFQGLSFIIYLRHHTGKVLMEQYAELLTTLLEKSAYAKHIKAYQKQLIEIAHTNEQIKSALTHLLTHSNFKTSHEIDLSQFPHEKKILNNFFEYVYFASDSFLKGTK